MHDDPTARFERLFTDHYPAIAGYLLRRSPGPDDAADAASEVFATAWRRLDDVPAPPEDRLWLFGVARHVLANHRRTLRRRDRLWHRLRDDPSSTPGRDPLAHPTDGGHAPPGTANAPDPSPALVALAALRDDDRELLTLLAWDGLDVAEIAAVLGVSGPVVSRRLYRARGRYVRALRAAGGPSSEGRGDPVRPGHDPADLTLVPETSR